MSQMLFANDPILVADTKVKLSPLGTEPKEVASK